MAKKKDSKYSYKKKSAWDILTDDQIKEAFHFSDEYKKFLGNAKTEREAIQKIKEIAEKHKKKIVVNRQSEAAIILPGKKSISEGVRLVISHVDSQG